jgi:hypothetical protein
MRYPSYTYAVGDLFTGSSLGNLLSFARLDEQTNLRGLWGSSDNQHYIGDWDIEISTDKGLLEPRKTSFFPESQSTDLALDTVTARKLFFIPFAVHGSAAFTPGMMRAAIYLIELTNNGPAEAEFVIRHTITFPAVAGDRFTKQPLSDQINKRVAIVCKQSHSEITTVGAPREARVFWSREASASCRTNDRTLSMEFTCRLGPGTVSEIPFAVHFSPDGLNDALDTMRAVRDYNLLLEKSRDQYREVLGRTHIVTPDAMINRGLQWSKVNTVRVQHVYRIGEGFTNDPPQDIVVIRDLGWYVLGSDYLTPEFSAKLLDVCGTYAFHEGGKLTEYLHADEKLPSQYDYGLNINDDTPLYVYGVFHHAVTSADTEILPASFVRMKRACDWIISQTRDGLVWCHAEGTGVWGICGWRNIIDGYNLTGAVTEVNAECYHALSLTARVADSLGSPDDAKRYREAAERMKVAMNGSLTSERTGLYLLNLGNDGVRHHDVTGDLIFPVMFGIADDEKKGRILRRLTDGEFWTPYGTRTVSPKEENYDPDFGYQLVGGVWPNLTAWTAFCIRKEQPEKLVEGMHNSYRLCEVETPRDFVNVVPGEFPERMHGETFVSRGMTMSPWMPPTYLWLGVEGLLGVRPSLEGLEISPAMPKSWRWVAVRDLLYKGDRITAFVYDGILYSTADVSSDYPVQTGELLPTSVDNEDILTIGMQIGNDALMLVASEADAAGSVVLEYGNSRAGKHVRLRAGEALLLRFPGVIPANADSSTVTVK